MAAHSHSVLWTQQAASCGWNSTCSLDIPAQVTEEFSLHSSQSAKLLRIKRIFVPEDLQWIFPWNSLAHTTYRLLFCCLGTKSCTTLCNPMNCSTPGSFVLHYLAEFAEIHIHWVGDAIYLILCHPLLLLQSIFPSIGVFSNQSVPHIKWPKYWSFNFSISPSSGYSGLISFRIDWVDLLAVQGTLKSLLQHHN